MTDRLREIFALTLKDVKKTHIVVGSNELSIDDDQWKAHPKVQKYALEQTKKELGQAVEGMYHNLNMRAA